MFLRLNLFFSLIQWILSSINHICSSNELMKINIIIHIHMQDVSVESYSKRLMSVGTAVPFCCSIAKYRPRIEVCIQYRCNNKLMKNNQTCYVFCTFLFFYCLFKFVHTSLHAGPRLSIRGLPDMPDFGHYIVVFCRLRTLRTSKFVSFKP